jgi:hypothetical protein
VRARVSQLPRRVSDDDEEGGGFFYNEEEVLAGAGGDERAAILDRFDAMLQIPSTDGVEDVRLSPPRDAFANTPVRHGPPRGY